MHLGNLRWNIHTLCILLLVTTSSTLAIGKTCEHCEQDDLLCLNNCLFQQNLESSMHHIPNKKNINLHVKFDRRSADSQANDPTSASRIELLENSAELLKQLKHQAHKRAKGRYFYKHIRFGKRLSPDEIPEETTFYPQGRFGKRDNLLKETSYLAQHRSANKESPKQKHDIDNIFQRNVRFQPQGRFGKRFLLEFGDGSIDSLYDESNASENARLLRRRRFQPQGRFGKRNNVMFRYRKHRETKEPSDLSIKQYLFLDKQHDLDKSFNRQRRFQPQGRFGKRSSELIFKEEDIPEKDERRFYPQGRFGKRFGDGFIEQISSRNKRFQPQGRFGKRSDKVADRYSFVSGGTSQTEDDIVPFQ